MLSKSILYTLPSEDNTSEDNTSEDNTSEDNTSEVRTMPRRTIWVIFPSFEKDEGGDFFFFGNVFGGDEQSESMNCPRRKDKRILETLF